MAIAPAGETGLRSADESAKSTRLHQKCANDLDTYVDMESAKQSADSAGRIEPARLGDVPAEVADTVAGLPKAGAVIGSALHRTAAANLATLVRSTNTYYSSLIEGQDTRPRSIERALSGTLDVEDGRRNLQLEGAAGIRAQVTDGIYTAVLKVCLDQAAFMSGLFGSAERARRLRVYVERSDKLNPGAFKIPTDTTS